MERVRPTTMQSNKCLLHGHYLDNRINLNTWIRNSIINLFYRMKLIPMITSRNLVSRFKTTVVDFDNRARDYLISEMILFYSVDQIFRDAFMPDHQLMSCRPKEHTFLASSLLLRGSLAASDIRRNIERFVCLFSYLFTCFHRHYILCSQVPIFIAVF